MENWSRRRFVKVAGGIAGMAILGSAPLYAESYLQSFFRKRGKSIPEVTPNEDFYVQSYDGHPDVNVKDWKLVIDGMVSNPYTLTYDQLLAVPSVKEYVTLICIGNDVGGDAVGNALWTGISLKELLDKARPKEDVKKVVFHSLDGYTDSVTLDDAMRPFNMLAYRMNEKPLPKEHGYPARILVPGIYGMKNAKWVRRIELVDYDFKGYWEKKGWSDTAYIKTTSKFHEPMDGDTVKGGMMLQGMAFASIRGISKVELSIDDKKTWVEARLKKPLSPYAWSFWEYDWKPAKTGKYSLTVRAYDGEGRLQEEKESGVFPDGPTGWHTVNVKVK
jgi:hypothetical protein